MTQSVVFIAYDNQDEPEKDRLLSHLSVLNKAGLIDLWSNDRIDPGAIWQAEIEQAMTQARVAILLITANFLGSDYILDNIVPPLLEYQRQGRLTVFPVIAKACPWQTVAWLSQMSVRPRNQQPVWGDAGRHVDEDLAAIAQEVAALVTGSDPVAVPQLAQSPIPNPFYTGGRINDPEFFFGRERLIREVRSELKKRSSVSLVGQSQMGKSSLLYYLYATRAEWLPNVTIEYIDLQRVFDEKDFYRTVLEKLGKTGSSWRKLRNALSEGEVVLLFDEMERLAEEDFNPRLHDLLRSLAQEPHFAMGLATQRPLVEVFPASTPVGVSPFHNIFTEKNIGPFSEAEARSYITNRLGGTGLSFTQAEIQQLLTDSQGHPANLAMMAKTLFAKKGAM